jgi:hypothetical protein
VWAIAARLRPRRQHASPPQMHSGAGPQPSRGCADGPTGRLARDVRRLVVLDGKQRRSIEIRGQYFKQNVHHRRLGLIINGVINVAGFKKEIARTINDRLFWQHVRHIPRRHLPDAGTDMIVLTNMAARSERQLGDAQLIFAVEFAQKAPEWRFEFDLCDQTVRVHFDRTAHLCQRSTRRRQQRQGGKALQRLRLIAKSLDIQTSSWREPATVIAKLGRSRMRRLVLGLDYLGPASRARLRHYRFTDVLSAANAMHLYGQYCPVARAAEIFADRWTMLIVRELLADVNHFWARARPAAYVENPACRKAKAAGANRRAGAQRPIARQADRISPDPRRPGAPTHHRPFR